VVDAGFIPGEHRISDPHRRCIGIEGRDAEADGYLLQARELVAAEKV